MGKIFMPQGEDGLKHFPLLSSQVQRRETTDQVLLNSMKSEIIVLSYSTLTNSKHGLRCSRPNHQVLMANLKNQVVFRILSWPWSVCRAWVCWALCEHRRPPPPQKLAKIGMAGVGWICPGWPSCHFAFPREQYTTPTFPLPVCWLSYKVLPRSQRMHSNFHSCLHTGPNVLTKKSHFHSFDFLKEATRGKVRVQLLPTILEGFPI